MNILVIGRGGREHTIIWSLAKSTKVSNLYCAPGNAGIAELATCVLIAETQFAELSAYAKQQAIDLIVVGPEDPLFAGAVDYFENEGFKVFGPRQDAAIIEGSKVFAKQLMKKYGIPSAAYETFDDYEAALAYVRGQKMPIVLKADGLAAGKGVIIAHTLSEAEQALREIMVDKAFGEAGDQVVIEEFLSGEEMTILAFVDGTTVRPMVPSQDHKPVFDNDEGPNTGGMGTYSPVPHIDPAIVEQAVETIVKPAAEAMVQEGRTFRGVLYAGLMLTEEGPKTIEFNCRFGDPETQVILPRLKSDLLDIMLATLDGGLADVEMTWSDEAAVCVVLASGGYPGPYETGLPISGLERFSLQSGKGGQDAQAGEQALLSDKAVVFHAGTAMQDGQMVTAGGRLLGVTGLGENIAAAREQAYAAVEHIDYKGKHFRRDIAQKALQSHP